MAAPFCPAASVMSRTDTPSPLLRKSCSATSSSCALVLDVVIAPAITCTLTGTLPRFKHCLNQTSGGTTDGRAALRRQGGDRDRRWPWARSGVFATARGARVPGAGERPRGRDAWWPPAGDRGGRDG